MGERNAYRPVKVVVISDAVCSELMATAGEETLDLPKTQVTDFAAGCS